MVPSVSVSSPNRRGEKGGHMATSTTIGLKLSEFAYVAELRGLAERIEEFLLTAHKNAVAAKALAGPPSRCLLDANGKPLSAFDDFNESVSEALAKFAQELGDV